MQKYSLPGWVRPYVYRYVRSNPASTVKFAISLIDVKRKKGEITKSHVKLPNGTKFKKESVLKLLNLFFYGEESMALIEKGWAEGTTDHQARYEEKFSEMAELDFKRTRAIKNLAEGLGHSVGEHPESIAKAFDRISKIENWHDRIITTGIILRYSYSTTFGLVFYRVFYPVSPEFMRLFGKAFGGKGSNERWDTVEARRLIQSGTVDSSHVMELARNILSDVLWSIDSNNSLAKELGLEREVRLLSDISIAYPFEALKEFGLDVDVGDEVRAVKRQSI